MSLDCGRRWREEAPLHTDALFKLPYVDHEAGQSKTICSLIRQAGDAYSFNSHFVDFFVINFVLQGASNNFRLYIKIPKEFVVILLHI